MRRSRSITLTLLTGATLVVAGCDDKPENAFFANQAACEQELRDPATCGAAEKQALEEHIQTAPKFASKEECESQFGAENCMQPENQSHLSGHSGGYFMPLMMGYMMGRMGGGGMFGGNRYAAQPVYRDKNNNAFTRGGGLAGMFRGNKFQSAGNAPFAGRTNSSAGVNSGYRNSTISRGGFGSRSYFGGS